MNEILTVLFARKSMRAYTKEPVSPEQKELILRAACAAPTAGNQQLYTILEITDQRIKDKLAVSCDDQPFIAEAAMILIFVRTAKSGMAHLSQAAANRVSHGRET